MSNMTVLAGFALMTFLPCAIAVLGSRDAENGWDWPEARWSRRTRVNRRAQAIKSMERVETAAVPAALPAQDYGDLSDPAIGGRVPSRPHWSRAMRSEIEALRARAAAARAEAELHEATAKAAAAKAEAAAVDALAAEAAAAAAIQEMRRAA